MFAGGYCGGMGLGGWLLMIGLWVALIAVVVWAVTRLFPTAPRRANAEELLDQRLATGEVDLQTYRAAGQEPAGAGRR